ncbi:MAG: 3-hydroxyacyl-CoA dehydrogenase family protein [Candidatus Hodarchaeota archaeon]
MEFKNIKKIGILGAGIMGPGIAEVLAIFGSDYDFNIYLYDISEQALQTAEFRMQNDFKKVESVGLFSSEDLYKARDRILLGTDFNPLSDSQLVIEAVPEKIKLKKEIFKKLDQHTSSSTILATNSSGLSITEIASVTNRPELCIGTHFMNPPLLMPLVEVVKGEETSEAVVQTMIKFLSSVNKRPVLVKKDLPGYVHNRLQAAVFREIMYLVDEDVMNIDDLETTVRYGLGLRLPVMKVFEMVDLMGLDTIQNVLSYLYPNLASSKKPPEFLSRMIRDGKLGVKSGKGFHDYSQGNMQESMRQKESATFQLLMMMQQYD